MRTTVGVVIPVWNESAILPACMAQAQQVGADAVIFVDGGSDDGSDDLLRAAGVHWIRARLGRASQMNAGAALLDCDAVVFLHADTDVHATHIEAVRAVMRNPDCVGGRFDLCLSGGGAGLGVIAALINLRSRLSRVATGDQAIFVRRSVFSEMGGFADIPLMEDVEFGRRLKRLGRIACLRDKITSSGRRWQQHGLLQTVVLMWWLRLRFWLGADPAVLARLYRDAR